MDSELKIELIKNEMDESNTHLMRQHSQIKWFFQLYFTLLTGYFALAGFLGKNQINYPASYEVIGMSATLLIFFFGWLLLSILGHKIVTVFHIHRHMGVLRGLRKKIDPKLFSENYVFEDTGNIITLPKLLNYTPYIFFALNYSLLILGLIFFLYQRNGIENAIIISLFISLLIGHYYPRVCITYEKHIRAFKDSRTFKQQYELESKYEDIRKKKTNYKIINYLAFTILTLLMFFCHLSAINVPHVNKVELVFVSITIFLVTGFYRYYIEKKLSKRIKV